MGMGGVGVLPLEFGSEKGGGGSDLGQTWVSNGPTGQYSTTLSMCCITHGWERSQLHANAEGGGCGAKMQL
jgi:hypothetical protein